MNKLTTYSLKGTKLAETSLPKDFAVKENLNLLAQAKRVIEENAHVGLASAKTRTEVNRTTKKWYKQKGTGGARHGARSAPIFVGGGVAHGPRPLRRKLSLNRKMARLAVKVALSLKFKQKEAYVVEGIKLLKKTAEGAVFIKKLVKGESLKVEKFTFILSRENLKTGKLLRNLKDVRVVFFETLTVADLVNGRILILDEAVFETGKKEKKA